MGEFRASVRKALKLPVFCAGFELDTKELLPLLARVGPTRRCRASRRLARMFALKVPAATSFGDLEQVVLESLTPEQARRHSPRD